MKCRSTGSAQARSGGCGWRGSAAAPPGVFRRSLVGLLSFAQQPAGHELAREWLRLRGPERPLQSQADRQGLLAGRADRASSGWRKGARSQAAFHAFRPKARNLASTGTSAVRTVCQTARRAPPAGSSGFPSASGPVGLHPAVGGASRPARSVQLSPCSAPRGGARRRLVDREVAARLHLIDAWHGIDDLGHGHGGRHGSLRRPPRPTKTPAAVRTVPARAPASPGAPANSSGRGNGGDG